MPQAKKPLVIMKRKGISMKIVFKEPLKSAEPGQRIELKKNKSGEWDVVQKGEILESGPHRELAKLKRDHYMGTLSEDQCSADLSSRERMTSLPESTGIKWLSHRSPISSPLYKSTSRSV